MKSQIPQLKKEFINWQVYSNELPKMQHSAFHGNYLSMNEEIWKAKEENLNWSSKGGRIARLGKRQYLKRRAENMPDFMITTNPQIQEINTEHINYKEIHTCYHTKTADDKSSTDYASKVKASPTKRYF